jgi:hypothetical protein
MNSTMDVLTLQSITPAPPPHPFVPAGHTSFNALLQARQNMFAGTLLVREATIWSAAFQGLGNLETFFISRVAPAKAGAPKSCGYQVSNSHD